ncbi:MAG: hypothetical protein QM804_02525 [Propionicimonas sp.]
MLLDFGHALFGGEPPAEAAQMLIDHGLLWGMDVNDNYRGWDDDMMVGSIAHGGDLRVLPRAEEERLGRGLEPRPVPVPGGRGGERQAVDPVPEGHRTERWTCWTRKRSPPPRPSRTPWPRRSVIQEALLLSSMVQTADGCDHPR